MPGEQSENKYGDFDPTTFGMENEIVEEDSSDKFIEVPPANNEIEATPEKRDNIEERIKPEEYRRALERILTTPERERAIDKLNRILKALESMEPKRKTKIMTVLGNAFSKIHKVSSNLSEAYESIELILDSIINDLEKK